MLTDANLSSAVAAIATITTNAVLEALNSLAGQVRQALTEAEIPFDRQDFNPHITLVRKPAVPEQIMLSEIEVPRATMIVKDVCLYRSDHDEQGMEYTVIGRSRQEGL